MSPLYWVYELRAGDWQYIGWTGVRPSQRQHLHRMAIMEGKWFPRCPKSEWETAVKQYPNGYQWHMRPIAGPWRDRDEAVRVWSLLQIERLGDRARIGTRSPNTGPRPVVRQLEPVIGSLVETLHEYPSYDEGSDKRGQNGIIVSMDNDYYPQWSAVDNGWWRWEEDHRNFNWRCPFAHILWEDGTKSVFPLAVLRELQYQENDSAEKSETLKS